MSRIEAGLHAYHASAQATASIPSSSPSSSNNPIGSNHTSNQGLIEAPFAKVNNVEAGSPAADAGLKIGDKIRRFGSVNWINHEKLSKVAETVQRNEGVSSPGLDMSVYLAENML